MTTRSDPPAPPTAKADPISYAAAFRWALSGMARLASAEADGDRANRRLTVSLSLAADRSARDHLTIYVAVDGTGPFDADRLAGLAKKALQPSPASGAGADPGDDGAASSLTGNNTLQLTSPTESHQLQMDHAGRTYGAESGGGHAQDSALFVWNLSLNPGNLSLRARHGILRRGVCNALIPFPKLSAAVSVEVLGEHDGQEIGPDLELFALPDVASWLSVGSTDIPPPQDGLELLPPLDGEAAAPRDGATAPPALLMLSMHADPHTHLVVNGESMQSSAQVFDERSSCPHAKAILRAGVEGVRSAVMQVARNTLEWMPPIVRISFHAGLRMAICLPQGHEMTDPRLAVLVRRAAFNTVFAYLDKNPERARAIVAFKTVAPKMTPIDASSSPGKPAAAPATPPPGAGPDVLIFDRAAYEARAAEADPKRSHLVIRSDELAACIERATTVLGGEGRSLRSRLRVAMELGPNRTVIGPDEQGVETLRAFLISHHPHFCEVTDFVTQHLLLGLASNVPMRLPPIHIWGQPGIGKTHYVKDLARLLTAPILTHSMENAQTGTVLLGAERYWANAQPGLIFETIGLGPYANPVIVLEELDKAPRGARYDPLAPLHTLLEQVSSTAVKDSCVQLTFDASLITYVATSNDPALIPVTLRSRFREFLVLPPHGETAVSAARVVSDAAIAATGVPGFEALSERQCLQLAHLTPREISQAVADAVARATANGRSRVESWDLPRALTQANSFEFEDFDTEGHDALAPDGQIH